MEKTLFVRFCQVEEAHGCKLGEVEEERITSTRKSAPESFTGSEKSACSRKKNKSDSERREEQSLCWNREKGGE